MSGGGWPSLSLSFQHSRLPRPCHCVLCSDRAGNLTLNPNLRHDSHPPPLSRGPLRLDFYHPFRPGKIVTKAAPRPILRFLHESSFHGIAMDVAQLLNAFGLAPNIEIVIPRLPEYASFRPAQLVRHDLFEHLQRDRELGSFWFGDPLM